VRGIGAGHVGPDFIHMPRSFTDRRLSRLADAALQEYVLWREQCCAVASSYQRWVDASGNDRALRFAAYTSALDQEERISISYEQALCLLQTCASKAPRGKTLTS
jgi:hypothetical protein